MPRPNWQRVNDREVVVRFRLDADAKLPESSLQAILFAARDAIATARASTDVESLPGLKDYAFSVSPPRSGKRQVLASFFGCLEVRWVEPQSRQYIHEWAQAASAHVLLRVRDAILCEQARLPCH